MHTFKPDEKSNTQDSILTIKIEYNELISLEDFNKSLEAWNNQFTKFSNNDKLHIKDIKQGSIIIGMVASVIPVMNSFSNILYFFDHVKTKFNWLADKIGEKPKMKIDDYEDCKSIIAPVNNSNGTQISISVNGENNVIILDSEKVKRITTNANEEISELRKTEESNDSYNNVVLDLIQIKNDENDRKNTKGIIEKIDKKPYPVVFDKGIKNEVLQDMDNPFLRSYLVNATVNKSNDKIVSYTISELKDSYFKENDVQTDLFS